MAQLANLVQLDARDTASIPSPLLMKEQPDGSSKAPTFRNLIRLAVVLWILGIVGFHLGCAALGRPIFRDQHIGTALEYAKGSINILKPVIVGFNLNNAPTPLELPIWQALVALVFKVFGTWLGWANVVSLALFFSCLYPLFRLAERFAGAETAWWSLLLFLAQPVIFVYAGEGSTDGFSLSTSIWFMFFATKLWEAQKLKWLFLTTVIGALAAVSKLPFFTAAGFGCFFMTIAQHRSNKRAILYLGMAALTIGAAFLAWSRYTDYCYAQAEFPHFHLRLSDPEAFWWWFGDLKYRLSPGVWIKGAWRIFTAHFGSFFLASLFFISFFLRSQSRLARWWLLGGVLTTLIFFHLVLHHEHYYLLFAPAVAMSCATVAVHLEAGLKALAPQRESGAMLVILLCLAFSTLQGVIGRNTVLFLDSYPYVMANVIKQHTTPTDKLLIQGGGWGGELLFLADRKGLSIWSTKLLEDRATYDRLRQLGFNKLVMVSESPMLTAIRHTHETSAVMKRESYSAQTTPIADTMPTVIQTEDILIKDIPGNSH